MILSERLTNNYATIENHAHCMKAKNGMSVDIALML